jgi:flagellar assembly protein FliH
MGIIKSTNVPPTLETFSMRDIEAQARIIITRAQQEADKIVSEAHVEGARIRQKSYDDGNAAGTQDGLKKGTEDGKAAGKAAALAENRAKLEQLLKTFTTAVSEMNASRAKLESTAATEVIKLAVAIARRVTKLQGSLDPSVLTENVRSAMKLAVHAADIRISVHPSQKQGLSELMPQLKMQWPSVSHVDLIDDAAMAVGSCRVFTASGHVDAELDQQIDRVAADLLPGAQGVVA